MALDNRYVTTVSLDEYFVDKDTGLPLAGGQIFFYKDSDRLIPKNVYELSGAPPNYTYEALPNPLILSAVGTPMDNNGNDISIYYYPYDDNDNIELYYVVVKNSNGVEQFTREGWPNTTAANNTGGSSSSIVNALSNPQFALVNFLPTNPLTISYVGNATDTIAIAPDWDLIINHTNDGSLTVARTAVAGISAYPGNPPYTLTITPGLNIAALQLRQRLSNNPNIFSPAAGQPNGYISGSILLGPNSSILSMTYSPNDIGNQTETILSANNNTGNYTEFNNTIQLPPSTNVNTGDTGFVDIFINLPIAAATILSNIQIVGLNSNVQGVTYEQTTVRRQIDQLFNYYSPLLQYKPINSYLIGWDFPLNPAQFLGSNIAASAAGANTSRYIWDQTLSFQSANNGAAISRPASGALRVTATNATQFALIQYLPQATARELLNNPLSVNIAALTPQAGGLVGTVSLWYTTDANLPSAAANNSIVATLNATGKPATFNGNWTEVTRNGLGNANFTIGNSATTNFNDYGFMGWNLNGIAGVNTATWFAIVVGFSTLNAAQTVDFQSVCVGPGNIPTRPAPQSQSTVLMECRRFYQQSFDNGVIPTTNAGLNTGEYYTVTTGSTGIAPFYRGNNVMFYPPFRDDGATVILYNPVVANNEMRNLAAGTDCTGSTAFNIKNNSFTPAATSFTGLVGNPLAFHWSADNRLGR